MLLKELLPSAPANLAELSILGITCDSRKVQAGYLFVCLCGATRDGHDFARDAIEKNAAAVITERHLGVEREITLPDTHAAYAELSAAFFHHPSRDLKLIGVTGTNGKTSFTYMLKSILEHAGHKTGVIGTIQNLIGNEVIPTENTTPDAYTLNALFRRMQQSGCEYVIMEVSSHALDQKRVYGLDFTVGAFTNLTRDHLDYHLTMENYRDAKKKLFSMCRTGVFNLDDPTSYQMMEGEACKTITYGSIESRADFSADAIELRPDGISYDLCFRSEREHVSLKTGGKFSVYNSLCAIACAHALGFSIRDCVRALSALNGVKGRAEVVPTGRDFTVIIDYAHTPDGLENILSTFCELKKGRLVCLFGCGGDRDATKRPIMGRIAAEMADFVIVTSDNPRTEDPQAIISDILNGMQEADTPFKVIESRIEAIRYAIQTAKRDDIIVLAGKGHEDYQILASGKIHLDEREVVAQALNDFPAN